MSVIRELPNTGFAPSNESIAKHLREQADWMVEENARPVKTVIMIIERMDGTLDRQICGHACDLARVIGLLSFAVVQGVMQE